MIISFDLDDTLIPGIQQFETGRRSFLQRVCGVEKVRVGAIALMKACKAEGHKVYVYTTSLRSTGWIWWTFFSYGVRLDKVINQRVHDRVMRGSEISSSKYPPAFKIDVHIDDARGVGMEGERYNFRTIIVAGDDGAWTEKVLSFIKDCGKL